MTRRAIGTSALYLLMGAVLAVSASASDVEREMPQTEESGMEAAPAAGGEAAATGTEAGPAAAGEAAASGPQAAVPAPTEAGAGGVGNPGWVERATFTTAVVDREPQDSIDSLTTDHTEVSFWSDLRALAGETVIHRWEHGGEVAAEVPFVVGGTRWRVHSTKRLDPIEAGTWRVSVVDASGRVLESSSFEYGPAAAAPQLGQGAPAAGSQTPPAAPEP